MSNNLLNSRRRKTRAIQVGDVGVGGENPVRIQSMTTSNTRDVEATVDQIVRLADAGCEIARVTVQGKKEAEACEGIKEGLLKRGYTIPLVADIHFYPPAALQVADFVEKVRINPGNFADKRAQFKIIEYDDATYQAEIERLEEKFTPLVLKCKRLGRSLRIGTNHGSLSDRIMNRYGDTPAGMVESAFEFARICRKHDFHNFLFSMKASNPLVMVEAYRLLVREMDKLGWDYPLHLGVTEAGEGEDGRVKSAIGIGTLLLEGLGDTVRVSLTEDPWEEIDPCKRLIAFAKNYPVEKGRTLGQVAPIERETIVPVDDALLERVGVPYRASKISEKIAEATPEALFWAPEGDRIEKTRALFDWMKERDLNIPVILNFRYTCSEDDLVIHAAAEMGALLVDGMGVGICIEGPYPVEKKRELAFAILQGARLRLTRTDFISCPGCGRTLFDLQEVSARIREKTGHLAGLKIAIMGCIVNGPGEMADADFGYVGSRPGKIDLYVGKECVERNIEMDEADERLIDLIKRHGKWVDA